VEIRAKGKSGTTQDLSEKAPVRSLSLKRYPKWSLNESRRYNRPKVKTFLLWGQAIVKD
jgi:hypothetical protein